MAPRRKKPKLNVVEFRPNYIPLNDIAGRLRYIADQIDKGEWGELESVLIIGANPSVEEFPSVATVGSIDGLCNPVMTLTMAKCWYLNGCLERAKERGEHEK